MKVGQQATHQDSHGACSGICSRHGALTKTGSQDATTLTDRCHHTGRRCLRCVFGEIGVLPNGSIARRSRGLRPRSICFRSGSYAQPLRPCRSCDAGNVTAVRGRAIASRAGETTEGIHGVPRVKQRGVAPEAVGRPCVVPIQDRQRCNRPCARSKRERESQQRRGGVCLRAMHV